MASTVTTSADFTGYQAHRRTAVKNNRHWVFYTKTADTCWKSSEDGSSWGGESTVPNWGYGVAGKVATCFETRAGTDYVHLAAATNTSYFYYKRGVLNADGTVTWTSTQTVSSNAYTYSPHIFVDSDGYGWFTARRYPGSGSYTYRFVQKNANNDGTWSTASGYPQDLSGSGYEWLGGGVGLASGKVVVWYGDSALHTIYAKRFNGTTWGNQETITTVCSQTGDIAGVAIDDDVYVTFVNTSNNIIVHRRTYDTGWDAGTTVYAAGATVYSTIAYEPALGKLYVFWPNKPASNHVYYKRSTALSPAWDADPTDWVSGETSLSNTGIITSEKPGSNRLGTVWWANSAIRYDNLPCVIEDISVTDSGSGSEVIVVIDLQLINVTDSGAGSETADVTELVTVIEYGIGKDVVYLLGELLIDGFSLEHGLKITVSEPTVIISKPVSQGLPTRIYEGKEGRIVDITGWVDNISDLNTITALADGAVHLIQLPTGTLISCHIPQAEPTRSAQSPAMYFYTIHAVERMD
jgi:hypothetical protein